PPSTTDDLYLPAFDALVPALVRAFQPEELVTQLGCDTHYTDPLAHLGLTVGAYRQLAGRLHDLAHTVAGGRWLATGGGGFPWGAGGPPPRCALPARGARGQRRRRLPVGGGGPSRLVHLPGRDDRGRPARAAPRALPGRGRRPV